MKKYWFRSFLVLGFLTAFPSWALELTTHLFNVENSPSDHSTYEVLAMNSPRVLTLPNSAEESLATARLAIQTKEAVVIELDPASGSIRKISLAPKTEPNRTIRPLKKWNYSPYAPTLLSSLNGARTLFNSVDSYSNSDLSDHCYSRAHYWARTFEVDRSVRSMKVFLLFTPLYRNQHRMTWWYHVAPYVSVQTREGEQQIVIDPSYEQAPKAMRDWVFHFAAQARNCRVANDINQYYAELALGGCVVVKGSMYAYTPQDLDSSRPLQNWRCEDLRDTQSNLPPPSNYGDWNRYEGFLPDYCNQGFTSWN